MLLPNESATTFNLESFSSAGSDLARGEEAFVKSRQTSKTNFADLYSGATTINPKFAALNEVFTTDSKFNSSNTFTSVKQTNFTSNLGASQTTPLDSTSQQYIYNAFNPTNISSPQHNIVNTPTSDMYNTISPLLSKQSIQNISTRDDSADNSSLLNKLAVTRSNHLPANGFTNKFPTLDRYSLPQLPITANLEDNKILAAEQAPQSYVNLSPSSSHPNFSPIGATLVTNYSVDKNQSTNSLNSAYNEAKSGTLNKQVVSKLMSSNLFFSGNSPSVLSNSFALGSSDIITSVKQATVSDLTNGTATVLKQKTPVSPLLNGPREKAPAIVNALY